MEMPREPVPTTEPAVESDNEEMGAYEAYSEQLVLSPTAEEAALAQLKKEANKELKLKRTTILTC